MKPKKTKSAENQTSKYYFTADTQAAIVELQTEQDQIKRRELYNVRIQPAFTTLVDNLIRIHKFEGLFKNKDELKHDCVTFLYETLGKFDNKRGSAAFSYFNVVAKNWLTVCSRARAARSKRIISIDTDPARETVNSILNQRTIPAPDADQELPDLKHMLTAIAAQEESFTEPERKCFNAILQMCEDPDIVCDAKKTHILAALKALAGYGRDFSVGMQRLRARYKAIRNANE